MANPSKGPLAPRALAVVFWALVAAFAALVLTVLFPDVLDFFRPVFLSLTALCFLLGVALLILAIKWKQHTLLRTFWILAGASTIGFAVGSVLHNAFYALGTVTGDWTILNAVMQVLEVVSFVFAVLLCPIAFLVGTVGAIVIIIRQGGHTVAPA